MDRDVAEKLIELVLAVDTPMNEALNLIKQYGNDEEIKPLRKCIASVGINLYADVLIPIFRKYPELHREDIYK